MQSTAKNVLSRLSVTLSPRDSEQSIARRAVHLLEELGITETWYHNCPALVLAGQRTCLSESGKDYVASDIPIGPTTLVTVDLSPSLAGVWGDCARSFYLEEGTVTPEPRRADFVRGQKVLRQLHASLLSQARPETTFADLCQRTLAEIETMGFQNVDFLGNVGHTIESGTRPRTFIETGNFRQLGSAPLFTFEPHLVAVGGLWGFKHEEIYYFQDGRLHEL